MIDKFLRAKHWQLFILMFGFPFLLQMLMMGSLFSSIISDPDSAPTSIFSMFYLFPIIMIIYTGALFGWFWSIAIGLQQYVPENISMKTSRFKVFFFIPLVYIILISILTGISFNSLLFEPGVEPSGGMIASMVGIIIPLHLLSMFGIFHSMYFVAKTLKTVLLQKEAHFGEYVGEFFMLWFYIIGLWIIQPKINKIVEGQSPDPNTIDG